MSELIQHSNCIEWRFERQILRIEPWGENSLRVRATCSPAFDDALQALLPATPCQAEIVAEAESLTLRNGNITATLNLKGQPSTISAANCCWRRCGASVQRWVSVPARRVRINMSAL